MRLAHFLTTSRLQFTKSRAFSTSQLLKRPFDKVLVANRGEIACRIQRTAQALNIKTVAVYSKADKNAQHVAMADEAYLLGPPPAAQSYLLQDVIIDIAKKSGAQAIHPGYGFLSETASFSRACAENDIEFIGPPVEAIEAMGSKSASKDIMIKAGVPVTPGYHGEDQSIETLATEAEKIGYPVLIKAVLGGGGKGMRIVESAAELKDSVEACQREAQASFGDSRVLVEKYLRRPRHIELQVFADKHGNVVHLFERDCSVQRRHQKVLEEAPAPGMSVELRKKMGDAAVAAAKAVNYVGAGTVEFMLDDDDESFYFMEMNTRLQVEHPVTEMITRTDLVELQLRAAAGQELPFEQGDLEIHGHAIEARVYAENPYNDFLPGTGKLLHMKVPELSPDVRVDTGVQQGDEVSVFYDPMIAKLIVHGNDREIALDRLIRALKQFQVVGLPTNIEFLARTASHPGFVEGGVNTSFLNVHGEPLTTPFSEITNHEIGIGVMAVILRQEHERRAQHTANLSPWSADSTQGFRSVGGKSTRRHIRLSSPADPDREINVDVASDEHDVSTYHLHLDENTVLKATGQLSTTDNRYSINLNNHQHHGTVVFENSNVWLFDEDGTQLKCGIQFTLPSPAFHSLSDAQGSEKSLSITTPMPGKISQILVEEGDQVELDQPLLIMEAMKMEHVIRATGNGQVQQIYYQVEDFVEDGKVLIDIE